MEEEKALSPPYHGQPGAKMREERRTGSKAKWSGEGRRRIFTTLPEL